MNKITIEKKEEEITYKQITTTHTFKINKKEVRVYCYDKQDMQMEDYESDTTIDEEDIEELTEEELQIFEDELNEYLDMKVGELKEVDGYEE